MKDVHGARWEVWLDEYDDGEEKRIDNKSVLAVVKVDRSTALITDPVKSHMFIFSSVKTYHRHKTPF